MPAKVSCKNAVESEEKSGIDEELKRGGRTGINGGNGDGRRTD